MISRGDTTQSEERRLGRHYVLVVVQRVALLCLCAVLAFVVALTYIYHHPLEKWPVWKGSFPDLMLFIGLMAAWPYVFAMVISWPPRKLSIVRTLAFAAVLVGSAAWVVGEILHNVGLTQSARDVLLFTSLQALIIGLVSRFLWPEEGA